MALRIDIDRQADGRWIARVPTLDGLTMYGASRSEALRSVQVEALRVLASQLERGERQPFGAFAVEPVEGASILALRSRAARHLRALQEGAAEAGVDELSEAEIDAEISAARAARQSAPGETDPPAAKNG
jgi:hypothetical protein